MHVDPASLLDLSILDPGDESASLFTLIDRTRSDSGRAELRRRMRQLPAVLDVRERQLAVRRVAERSIGVRQLVDEARPDDIEKYLSLRWQALTRRTRWGQEIERWVLRFRYQDAIRDIRQGVQTIERLLRAAGRIGAVVGSDSTVLSRLSAEVDGILATDALRELARLARRHRLGAVLQADRLARGPARDAIKRIVAIVAELDALQSLATATVELDWCFPELTDDSRALELHALRHPRLATALPNDVQVADTQRVMAITGPNMAGKSTLLKAIGSTVYLAHLGCGVPAKRAVVPLFHAMLASLVVRDSVSSGRSFYLTEVRRIRDLVAALSANRRVFAVLDEPFKGTNVEDASDATSLLLRGLCAQDESLVILTTHLSSVVESAGSDRRLNAMFLSAALSPDGPVFDYQLRSGVSSQRLGMVLLEQEGVAPALAAAIQRQLQSR